MSGKLRKKEKLEKKIAAKSREWVYLKESQEDFESLYDIYENELTQALTDLSQFNSCQEEKNEEITNQGFSSHTIDSRSHYDDLGNLDITENISSNNPSWAKNLYKQIARHTHPDKVEMMEVGEEEKSKREKIFKDSTQSLQDKKYEDLIYNAHKLNLDIGIENEEYLSILNHSIQQISKSVEKKKDNPPWHWGNLEGLHQLRCDLIYFVWNQLGEQVVPKEVVLEYIKHFEDDTIPVWKLKYLQSSPKTFSTPEPKLRNSRPRKKPGPSIASARRGKRRTND